MAYFARQSDTKVGYRVYRTFLEIAKEELFTNHVLFTMPNLTLVSAGMPARCLVNK